MSEWIKTAKVGDKVVCVDAAERRRPVPFILLPGMDGLRQGATYTIRDISFCPVWNEVQIRLEEIRRLPFAYHAPTDTEFEAGYGVWRFRPVVDSPKTDISVFTDMLKSVGKPVKETV